MTVTQLASFTPLAQKFAAGCHLYSAPEIGDQHGDLEVLKEFPEAPFEVCRVLIDHQGKGQNDGVSCRPVGKEVGHAAGGVTSSNGAC